MISKIVAMAESTEKSKKVDLALNALIELGCVSPSILSTLGHERILREIYRKYGGFDESHWRSANKFIGHRLQMLRFQNGYSQEKLRSDLNQQLLQVAVESVDCVTYISKVETGRQTMPTLHAIALARIFGRSVENCFCPWTYLPEGAKFDK
jgi:DNA-binding XRE family transcriptional regulator